MGRDVHEETGGYFFIGGLLRGKTITSPFIPSSIEKLTFGHFSDLAPLGVNRC